jgi:hypothetical protein
MEWLMGGAAICAILGFGLDIVLLVVCERRKARKKKKR